MPAALKYMLMMFADYYSSDGYYVESAGGLGEIDSEQLEKRFKKVKISSCYMGSFTLEEKRDVQPIGYDADFVKRHRPELSDGVWLTDIPKDEEVLHVVVVGSLKDQKPGTILHGQDAESGKEFSVKVVGVLNDHATIIGHPNGSRKPSSSYTQMFTNLGSVEVTGAFLLFDKEEAERLQKEEGVEIHCGILDVCLIRYQGGISEQDATYNQDILIQTVPYVEFDDLSSLNKYSIRQMGSIVYTLIPVIVACFVMTLVTAVCSGAIMLRRQMHDYAVYYMSGMKWSSCAVVNLCVNLLETAQRWDDFVDEDVSIPVRLQKGEVLFYELGNSSIMETISSCDIFKEPVTAIGYPCEDRNGSYFYLQHAFGICAQSGQQEGAWDFLRELVSKEHQERMVVEMGATCIPTRKDVFERMISDRQITEGYTDEYGYIIEPYADSNSYEPLTDEQVQVFLDIFNNTHKAESSDKVIWNIVSEEAERYHQGEKDVDETARIIQNRVSTYVNELR